MKQEGWFDANAEVRLYEQRLVPDGNTAANIVIIHGFGDHSARYAWTMDRFLEAGMASYAYDQRGHGRSPGRRGYIGRFEDLLDDLDVFLEHIRPDLADAPLFLMGHSMGGMVLARYAETRQIAAKGLVFSSPFLAFSDEVPKWLVALGPVIAKVAPWLPIGGVDNRGLSRDPQVVADADKDPLCFHGRVAAHTGSEFYRIIQHIHEDAKKVTAPMFVVHGGADRVVSPSGSEAFHNAVGSTDKTFVRYPEGYHELFNDLDKGVFVDAVIAWIRARI